MTGWRWHYRPATYIHRLVGRTRVEWNRGKGSLQDVFDPRPHWTLVKEILPEFRSWGFYVQQPDGHFAYIPWREYIFNGVRS